MNIFKINLMFCRYNKNIAREYEQNFILFPLRESTPNKRAFTLRNTYFVIKNFKLHRFKI